MEEEKAAEYYNELVRKGEGAARFKQGLGFSSTTTKHNVVPARGSALPSSSASSFLSSFVKASSPTKASEFEKQAQLQTIQNKLKKKPQSTSQAHQSSRVSTYRSPEERGSRHRHRSSSRDRDIERERDRERSRRRRRRSRSRSVSDEDRRRRRDRRLEKSGGDKGLSKVGKERNGAIDYSKLIEGFDTMSSAERVKAKMKLQLSETAEKDATNSMGSGWERFEFNKDAPLDDEEIEAVEDDAELVKHIGQSFRFSAVETRREDQIKAAHDEAMFGASSIPLNVNTENEVEQEDNKIESKESAPATTLLSDTVIARQQGSWRDRARKV
ncbi:zinc finger CCCH domain-containing protein 13 [Camellia sinensis]|uniref:zinc finger CCCH domain-containing protein 13 n=1 Tax=Camellia sinensis TaxID=4442 RepID=UPI001036AFA9|nr:zinc finger CCCH domain-containing protein 13 [Camellia sinensis]